MNNTSHDSFPKMPDSLTTLPDNYTLLQINPPFAANLYGEPGFNWLFAPDENGVWQPLEKLDCLGIMQAEDQRDYGIIIDASKPSLIENKGDVPCKKKKWWGKWKIAIVSFLRHLKECRKA